MIKASNFIRTIALAGATFAFTPFASQAATITSSGWYSAGNPGTRTLTPTDWANGTQTITVAQFNPALGQLNSATVTFYGDLDANGSLTANGDISVNQYDVSERIRLLPGSFAGTYTTNGTSAATLLEVSPSVASVTPGSYSSGTVIPVQAANSSATSGNLVVTGAGLGQYQGTGAVLYHLFTATRAVSDVAGGNFAQNIATAARAQVTVTYDYTASTPVTPPPPSNVPEPASLTVLGLGLLGIGAIRFRRR